MATQRIALEKHSRDSWKSKVVRYVRKKFDKLIIEETDNVSESYNPFV